jgi:heme-degrading monooxygenase HmoA
MTNQTEQPLRFQVFFSGRPGTEPERYLCSEWATRDAAEGWIESAEHFGGTFELIDTGSVLARREDD